MDILKEPDWKKKISPLHIRTKETRHFLKYYGELLFEFPVWYTVNAAKRYIDATKRSGSLEALQDVDNKLGEPFIAFYKADNTKHGTEPAKAMHIPLNILRAPLDALRRAKFRKLLTSDVSVAFAMRAMPDSSGAPDDDPLASLYSSYSENTRDACRKFLRLISLFKLHDSPVALHEQSHEGFLTQKKQKLASLKSRLADTRYLPPASTYFNLA